MKNSLATYCNKQELRPEEANDLARLITEITELGQIFKNSKTLNDAKLRQVKSEVVEAPPSAVEVPLKLEEPEQKPTLPPLFVLPKLSTRNDSVITQLSATPAVMPEGSEVEKPPYYMEEDSGSMDQPIALDPKALLGRELDSPTMPMMRFLKKRSSAITVQHVSPPCRHEINSEELDPNDAVIRLLNHEEGAPVDESSFA